MFFTLLTQAVRTKLKTSIFLWLIPFLDVLILREEGKLLRYNFCLRLLTCQIACTRNCVDWLDSCLHKFFHIFYSVVNIKQNPHSSLTLQINAPKILFNISPVSSRNLKNTDWFIAKTCLLVVMYIDWLCGWLHSLNGV